MAGAVGEHTWPVVLSVLLHAGLAAGMVLMTLVSITHSPSVVQSIPVNAVVVDAEVLRAAQRAQAEEAQHARAAAEEAQAAAAAQAAEAKQAADAKLAAEAKAAADAKQEAEARAAADAKQAAEAKAAADAKQAAEAKAAADAKQAAEAKQAADAKRAADERARREREAELHRQIADEEHASAIEASPLRDRYIASLRNSIQKAWFKPNSARVGIDCLVEVTQVRGGEVTNARVTKCNGDAAVRQSIENAVYKASPLPDPPDPALFQSRFVIEFKPDE